MGQMEIIAVDKSYPKRRVILIQTGYLPHQDPTQDGIEVKDKPIDKSRRM